MLKKKKKIIINPFRVRINIFYNTATDTSAIAIERLSMLLNRKEVVTFLLPFSLNYEYAIVTYTYKTGEIDPHFNS